MSSAQTTTTSAEARFWERFVERLRRNGAKKHTLRRHLRRAEESRKAFPDKRLREHTRSDVTGYLEQAGRLGRIADWVLISSSRRPGRIPGPCARMSNVVPILRLAIHGTGFRHPAGMTGWAE